MSSLTIGQTDVSQGSRSRGSGSTFALKRQWSATSRAKEQRLMRHGSVAVMVWSSHFVELLPKAARNSITQKAISPQSIHGAKSMLKGFQTNATRRCRREESASRTGSRRSRMMRQASWSPRSFAALPLAPSPLAGQLALDGVRQCPQFGPSPEQRPKPSALVALHLLEGRQRLGDDVRLLPIHAQQERAELVVVKTHLDGVGHCAAGSSGVWTPQKPEPRRLRRFAPSRPNT